MCAGKETYNKKEPIYSICDVVYFCRGVKIKKGVIMEIDNRSISCNKVVYKVMTNGKCYFVQENQMTNHLSDFQDSIDLLG